MGRRRKDEEEKLGHITIRLKKETIYKLRQIKGYNAILEKLINEYLEKKD